MKKREPKSPASRRPIVLIVVGLFFLGSVGTYLYARYGRSTQIRNVLLVSIDTCRADRLGCYGYARPTTPHVDALAREGVRFRSAFATVPLTTASHGSMLTGTYPPTHGVRLNNGDRLVASNVTLAETLRAAGFQTAAFVGAFPLDPRFGLDQGFDAYDCPFTHSSLGSNGSVRTAEQVNRPALLWLDKHAEQPFFLFLHYFDAHEPYAPPPSFATRWSDDPYASEIAYIDHCIGQVMDRLRELDAYDDTLVIITADHGESLGEHGESTHALFVYQSTLHVPLIVRAPRGRAGTTVAGNVSSVDIVPTVLDLVGLPIPPHVQGVSLAQCLDGAPVPVREIPIYAESLQAATFGCSSLSSVVEGSWKYIRAPRAELYDLGRDAGEVSDLSAQEPIVAQRLRERLEALVRKLEASAQTGDRPAADPDTLKQLESLGYVGGGVRPAPSMLDGKLEDPKDFLPMFEILHRAQECLQDERVQEARRELLALAEQRPRLITAHAMLAMIADGEQRFHEAAQRCAVIVEVLSEMESSATRLPNESGEPILARMDTRDLANAHANLALMLGKSGQVADAIKHYQQALERSPEFADARFELAILLARTGQMSEAVEHFTAVVRIRPDHVSAHVNLANAMMRSGKPAPAMGHYEHALRVDPNHADALYYCGLALQTLGRSHEAVQRFERLLQLHPDYARAQPGLTQALAAARRSAGMKPR